MKNKQYLTIIISLVSLTTSCQKKYISDTLPATIQIHTGLLERIQQGTDRNLNNDTINILRYDSLNRLVTIIDSVYQDTLTGTYNTAGLLETVKENSPYGNDHCTYTYNAAGQLTGIDATIRGEQQQFIYEYTDSSLSKATYLTNAGSGPLSVSGYYYYTVRDHNITGVSEFAANGRVIKGEKALSYCKQLNYLHTLLLFNIGNHLGFSSIGLSPELYFSACMPSSATWSGNGDGLQYAVTYTYSNNYIQKPASLTATMTSPTLKHFNLFFEYN